MTWTQFHDMNSGGGRKEKWSRIYIEAPEQEAKSVFYAVFGHNPDRVTCTCCGNDYSITESESLAQLTGYERNCDSLETPRDPETNRYVKVEDPWFNEHYYLEPGEEEEARRRGYEVRENIAKAIGRNYPNSDRYAHKTLDEYLKSPDAHFIYAKDIKPEQRTVEVPEQGYVYVD